MNRIKSYFYTILAAAAFIYGSFLCSLHEGCFQGASKESLLLFCAGLAVIIIAFFLITLLIKNTHPETLLLHRMTFSICIAFILYMGTRVIAQTPFIQEAPVFSADNMVFFFGVYLEIFGISFLHFLIKNNHDGVNG